MISSGSHVNTYSAHLSSHVVESLLGVDTRFQGRSPAGSVHGGTVLLLIIDVLPVNKKGDGVLGTGVTAHRSSYTGSGGSGDLDGTVSAFYHPAVDLSSASV